MIKTRDDLQDCLDKDKRALGMRDFLLYGQRVTKSDSQTVQDCFQLFYHPGQNFLFDFIAVQEQTVNFGI